MTGPLTATAEGRRLQLAHGQRTRVVPAPWDGLGLPAEEVERLALAASYWQSAAGWSALDEFLRLGATREAAAAVAPLLLTSLDSPTVAMTGRS